MEITQRTLVLNADYSPIGTYGFQKAFLLVFLQKAEMLVSDQKLLRTVSKSYNIPSVIKLHKYANIPYKGVVLTRQNIFKRDGFKCQYCGTGKDLTLDHLIPRSKGGKSLWNNLVTACSHCNARKGHASPSVAGLVLARQPFKPSNILFIRAYSGQINEQWLPYLCLKDKLPTN